MAYSVPWRCEIPELRWRFLANPFCVGRHHWSPWKRPKMAIRHKNKVGYMFLIYLKKNSSLIIPLLQHAASFNTEVEWGRMVKEWDFEAGKNKNKISNFVFMSFLYLFLAFVRVGSWSLPTHNWLNTSLTTSQFRNFTTSWHTISHTTNHA